MKWKGRKGSANVEDRRGKDGIAVIGGGFGLILILIFSLFGGDSGGLFSNTQIIDPDNAMPYQETEEEKELSDFVSVVLKDTEVVWTNLFSEHGLDYQEPTLVLYTGHVQSACGEAGSAVGTFYCPEDFKLYIDLSFYQDLQNKLNAPGDFAMAYVIAHEVGHHVQTLLGINDEVNSLRSELNETEFNKYLVRLELQADYFSGVWAHHAAKLDYLDEGDLEEALNAASAVGDDRLQSKAQGYVVPESFTHGTSKQRVHWFTKGFKSGSINDGDTFNAVLE